MMMRIAMRVVRVVVTMMVMVRMIVGLRRRGGAQGRGAVERAQKRQKRAPLHP